MKALLIHPANHKEMEFLTQLLNKLGVSALELTQEELEDYGMALLIKDVDRSDKVDKSEVMKKLLE
jgi:16S rRNA G527 N7-methylase RsmG